MHMHHDEVDSACACTTLRKAARAVGRVYDEALAPAGMSTAQFAILRHVARGAPLPLSRLAEQLVMDRSSLYRALTPVEKKGWVSVAAGPGRAKLASLTEAGQTALAAGEGHWRRAQREFDARMGGMWTGLAFALEALTERVQR